jgi:hypothetical protein
MPRNPSSHGTRGKDEPSVPEEYFGPARTGVFPLWASSSPAGITEMPVVMKTKKITLSDRFLLTQSAMEFGRREVYFRGDPKTILSSLMSSKVVRLAGILFICCLPDACKEQVRQNRLPPAPDELRSTANAIAPPRPTAHDWGRFASHMQMTPLRSPNRTDSVRIVALADSIRRAIDKYRDVRVARVAGYQPLVPDREFREKHFSRWNGAARRLTFQIDNPASLLYRKDSSSRFVLVGAMYVVPGDYTEAALDSLVPLSIARWHKHINWCIPQLNHQEDWTRRSNGDLIFGVFGVDDRKSCEAAGGVFKPDLAGWMIHSLVFAGSDLKSVWGGEMMGAAIEAR